MDLQLALLLIGILIVAVIAATAYDKGALARSIRRGLGMSPPRPLAGRRREPALGEEAGPPPADDEPSADVLSATEGGRKYLTGGGEPPPLTAVETAPDPLADELEDLETVANQPLNLNPGFDPPGTGPEAARELGVHVEPDEAIDFIIHLPGPGPVHRRSALAVYKQNEYQLDYPRQLYGRRYQTNFWSVVQHDSEATQYSDLKLAVQLIDAPGPIDESQLNTFVQVGLKLADALRRPTKLSRPFEQALAYARSLQQFYDEHDVVAGVNLVSEAHAPFNGDAVHAAMERAGLKLGAGHVFEKRSEETVLYSLSRLDAPGHFKSVDWNDLRAAGLCVQMSVPRVPDPAAVFDAMIATAKEVRELLGGTLVDHDRRPLTDKGIGAIRSQIQGIDAKMRAFGIAPGSQAARRLFAGD